jgi:hypothetical protein
MAAPRMRRGALLAIVALVPLLGACGDSVTPTEAPAAQTSVARLTVTTGDRQRMWSGRRSTQPFQVRALDAEGAPVAGARVRFALEGTAGGVLSQPEAVSDENGHAETFLLDAKSGEGGISARSGSASARFSLIVDRAPGELRFAPSTGAVGLPGHPHPDEVVSVQVFDTEGRPLAGTEVWFVGPERLSTFADTSDAQGWAETRVLQSEMKASGGDIWAFVLEFPEVSVKTKRALAPAAERVFLVSIDGLRADAIARYRPPTLTRLAAEGASTTTARTVAPGLTTPAHLSLLSGVSPEKHGVWGDDLSFTPQMASLDPLFRNAGRAGLQAHAFMSREGPLGRFELALQCKLAFGLDSLTLVEPAAARIAGAAMPSLRDDDVEMVFMHVPDPDLAGHAHGWESPEYEQAVLRADAALARVVEELHPGTLLIVVSDHGGGGAFGPHLHGSQSDVDMLIPMIFWGSRVTPKQLGATSILDVPATMLWALGLRPPTHYEGRPLLEAFR